MLRTKYLAILEELQNHLNSGEKRFGDNWPFLKFSPSPFTLAVDKVKAQARIDKLFDSELLDVLAWPFKPLLITQEKYDARNKETRKQTAIYEDLPNPEEDKWD